MICKSQSCVQKKYTKLEKCPLNENKNIFKTCVPRVAFEVMLTFERYQDCIFRYKAKENIGVKI